jgi:dihydroorotase
MLRVEGRIANHNEVSEGAIEIDEASGLIVEVGPVRGRSDIDTAGCVIFPGFGDLHVHAREDVSGREVYKEDFASASAAAIHGGVTHFADMPNNVVAPIDDASYAAKERLTEGAAVHITLYGGIGPGTHPLARAVPYKAFMGPSVGELFFRSPQQLEETIARYRGCNVSFHCEDPLILDASRGATTHEQRRPARAEVSATRLALELIERYQLRGKLCHFSTGEGMRDVIAAKQRGLRVTCEVTPHHLYFDDTMLNDENRLWLQMNPPLRGPEDRLAMIEALRTGAIDYLATDHAPHTLEEKQRGTSGVPHLDTYGAFTTWLMKEHGFTPQQIARVCAWNPGQFVREYLPQGSGYGFGRVEAGYLGSLTILDMQTPYTVRRETLRTKCGWSPFEGVTFPGSVRHTIVRGRVYRQAEDGAAR